jgi:serine/threonine protein kinase
MQTSAHTAHSVQDSGGVKQRDASKPGWRTYMVQDQLFEVPDRYELLHCIGRGAFGVVCSAKLKGKDGTEERVAIKKIMIREDNILEVKRLVREIYLLRHFDHENIISLIDIVEPATMERFEEIYIVTELMDTDLHQIIRSQQQLTEEHVQFFLYQLLRGLKAIHAGRVLHRDLKPSNIVVNANCDLKICDFGLAREQDLQNDMTDYVATRWYRAPELLMQWKNYSGSVDVWSVGCIFAELLARKPLFPGKNYLDQLHIILDVVGTPNDEEIDGVGSDKARNYVRQLRPKRERRDLRKMFPSVSEDGIDLLDRMLVFDPQKRLSAKQCLEHKYFASMHDEEDEPDAEPFGWEIDIADNTLTVFDLKELMWSKLSTFHPEYKEWKWWSDEEKALAAQQKKEKIARQAAKEAKDKAAAAAPKK